MKNGRHRAKVSMCCRACEMKNLIHWPRVCLDRLSRTVTNAETPVACTSWSLCIKHAHKNCPPKRTLSICCLWRAAFLRAVLEAERGGSDELNFWMCRVNSTHSRGDRNARVGLPRNVVSNWSDPTKDAISRRVVLKMRRRETNSESSTEKTKSSREMTIGGQDSSCVTSGLVIFQVVWQLILKFNFYIVF